MIIPQLLKQTNTRACGQEEGKDRPHVLNEDLFRLVLIRERKRADRSNQSLVLLLLDMNDGLGADSSSLWETVIASTLGQPVRVQHDLRRRPSVRWTSWVGSSGGL